MEIINLERAEILVVDDNPLNIKILSSLLNKHGYLVRAAHSGEEALLEVSQSQPDLILLDIMMPNLSGYEVCCQLRNNTSTAKIPIIFLSALHEPHEKVQAFRSGGNDYIMKPFHTEEVIARIENQLNIQRLRRELEASQRNLEQQNRELASKHEELVKSHQALVQAQRHIDLYFSVFTNALQGTIFDNKYELEQKIGEGGFGTVYRATQIGLQRPVAIKIFRPSEPNLQAPDKQVDRFRREGIAACRIQHINAVSVLDFGITSAGIPYLVMELLSGKTLNQELSESQHLTVRRCAEIIIPICNLLVKAHEMGLVHRDIKPDNIVLHQSDEGEIVKVVDFGIARLVEDNSGANILNTLTVSGNVVGTPLYMSPERLKGMPCGSPSDIYSLGITLYQMLCGELPFESVKTDLYSVVTWHLTMKPSPLRGINPFVPLQIEDLVLRMLFKLPEQRPTAQEIILTFQSVVTSQDHNPPFEGIRRVPPDRLFNVPKTLSEEVNKGKELKTTIKQIRS